jgi:type II secretory pathway pseudopilin PulG
LIQTYHHGRFEFFVVIIVVAILALAALSRYSLMAEDARVLRLELISHQFMTGAANLRAQFFVSNIIDKTNNQNRLDVAGQGVYFSERGWPVSTAGPVAKNYQPTDEDCYQLWQLLLQNPAPITKGASAKSRREYRVFTQANGCRYQYTDGAAYFDYAPLDGRLIFIPDGHESFNIN